MAGTEGQPRRQRRDAAFRDDILTLCELVFTVPGRVQSMSAAVHAEDGIVFRSAVPGRLLSMVFCGSDGPRVEAFLPIGRLLVTLDRNGCQDRFGAAIGCHTPSVKLFFRQSNVTGGSHDE